MNKQIGLVMIVTVILLDQGTKYLALQHLNLYESIPVFSVLNWTLAYNTGAAFSFLSHAGQWHTLFFLSFSLVLSLILIVWFIRLPKNPGLLGVAISLVLGGAIGNLCDRVRLGYVIDFIDLHYQTVHWPVFNVADSAITLGALLLLYDWIKD